MADGRWARTCPTCSYRHTWTGPMMPEPPCPQCKRRLEAEQSRQRQPSQPARGVRLPTADSPPADDQVKEALDLCDEIESVASEIPDAGADFAISVTEKAASIRSTIEQTNRATGGQISALENMLSGLQKWIRD